MPSTHAFAVFVPAALLLLAIPGPAVLYIVATSVEGGRRKGLLSVAGVHLGSLVHVAAAVAGLSALIVSSAIAFSTIKYVGAAYLVVVGIKKWLEREQPADRATRPPKSGRRVFTQGVVVNVLNPKTALFFLAFLPQFVDRARGAVPVQVATFGIAFVLLGLCTDTSYALVAGTVGPWLRDHARLLRGERYVVGSAFVGLGVAAAFSGGDRTR